MMGGSLSRVEMLEALSRQRPLTEHETLQLERAVRRTSERREQWHWNRADDYRLLRHLLSGRKPKTIAILMKRSEQSIWTRLKVLGIRVRKIEAVVAAPGSGRRSEKSPMVNGNGNGRE